MASQAGGFEQVGDPTELRTAAELLTELDRWRVRAARGRGKVRVSLQDIAAASGVPRSSLANYLGGVTLMPADVLDRVVLALGANPIQLRQWATAWERVTARPDPPGPAPVLLPADIANFSGRLATLRDLSELLEPGAALPVAVIAGGGGIGKTAMAVHWAHRNAARFPDGQLFVDLRGYDPGEPMRAEAALELFLRAMGVDTAPVELDQLVAAYRGALAGRHMLIVLDNARSAEQVRPLLPGAAGCGVIVTSRDSLSGLVARDGARRLRMDGLTDPEAIALLEGLLGRVKPGDLRDLAGLCGGLPLALRLAAERILGQPGATVPGLVSDLRDARLDLLDADGDQRSDLRAVFSWSLQAVPPAAAELFTALGLVPGPDLDSHAAACLGGIEVPHARRLLELLARAHLLQPTTHGRWTLHDLLRAYAAELAGQQPDALTRLLDFYRFTAATAMDLVVSHDRQRRPQIDQPAEPTLELTTVAQARAWLETERDNLAAAVRLAATAGWSRHATDLSAILWRDLETGGHWAQALDLHRFALLASRAEGDRIREASALNQLAAIHWRTGRYDEARENLEQALKLARAAHDRAFETRLLSNLANILLCTGKYHAALNLGELALGIAGEIEDERAAATALVLLGPLGERLGRYEQARSWSLRALSLCREHAIAVGEASALTNLGTIEASLGEYQAALRLLQKALALNRENGDPLAEACALTYLGEVHTQLGLHDPAAELLRQALAIFRRLGARNFEAQALNGLGALDLALGEPDRAMAHHRDALKIATEVGELFQQARAHAGLADTASADGEIGSAAAHRRSALDLYDRLGVPDGERLRGDAPSPRSTREVAGDPAVLQITEPLTSGSVHVSRCGS